LIQLTSITASADYMADGASQHHGGGHAEDGEMT